MKSKAAVSEIRDLLAVLQALGPDPRLRVTRLQLGATGESSSHWTLAQSLSWAQQRTLGPKARLLVAAIEQIGIERIKRLDLSIPRTAYWEPREGHQSAQVR